MDLTELHEVAEKEQTTQPPMRLRCCTAAGCMSANAQGVLDQLQAMSADPNPHVAALVCDRIPKAPNPDPALFH